MYQKEIIYLGLYKDGSRMGSAGFLKVENREWESRLYLKIQNVPSGIGGRFPVRVYDGSGWRELKAVTVQDQKGNWEENLNGNVDNTVIQIILSGGYVLEGKSRFASKPAVQQSTPKPENDGDRKSADLNRNVKRQESPQIPKERTRQDNAMASEVMEPQDYAVMREDRKPRESAGEPDRTNRHDYVMEADNGKEESPDTPESTGEENVVRDIPADVASDGEDEHNRKVEVNTNNNNTEKQIRLEPWMKAETPPAQASPNKMPQNTRREPQTILITEELPRRASGNTVIVPQQAPEYSLKEDKWEQILATYEQIHPYGDERVYVRIEPKDFVILQSKYQHLVNNSFLLHGFYNYRYIILGKEQDYYLGVPGVFYEREKMVALMFGFEAFECPGGNVRAGEFGYYLRKVEI